MAEIDAKDLEEVPEALPEAADKEVIVPAAAEEEQKESAIAVPPEMSDEEKEVTVDVTTAAATKEDSKKDAIADPPAVDGGDGVDLSIYTEDKLYGDIQELIASEGLDPTTASKKVFRGALSSKYGLGPKGKMFKKHEPFNSAIVRIATEFAAKQKAESDGDENKKSKKKRSRKRKRPQSNDDDEERSDDGAPTKKRKTNDGGAVTEGDQNEDGDGGDDGSRTKSKNKEGPKKKKKAKQPYENSLQKLKKLARAVGLANPKMYGKLKAMSSNKKQVDFLKELLAEHEVPTANLSEVAIKKIKADYDLKREMAELGIAAGGAPAAEAEDGVPLSCRRAKRTRSKVDYRPPKYSMDDNEDGAADGGDAEDGDDGEDEYVGDGHGDEESEDEYEPSDDDSEE